MNTDSMALCEKLVPASYIQQGCQAKKIRENQIRTLIQHVSTVMTLSVWKTGLGKVLTQIRLPLRAVWSSPGSTLFAIRLYIQQDCQTKKKDERESVQDNLLDCLVDLQCLKFRIITAIFRCPKFWYFYNINLPFLFCHSHLASFYAVKSSHKGN